MTTETKTVTVEIDPAAQAVLRDMQAQLNAVIASPWATTDPKRVLEMSKSLASALCDLSSWGDARVYRDGDLSLLVITPHITFGLIGHRDFRADLPTEGTPNVGVTAPMMGQFCWSSETEELAIEQRYCAKPIEKGEPTCEGHTPLVFSAPVPIRWSYHS